nr:cysteine/glutathione ABC transporter ATP-binding protein/permease CydC [Sansalvadorimonas sp. 2012CJ34-2]
MNDLWPFLRLSGRYGGRFSLGFLLGLVTLVSSVGLLALSGWFITATALAGLTVATAQVFNFLTPGAGVRGFSIARTAGRYGERLVSHDATFRLLAHLRTWFFEKVEPLAPSGLRKYRQADLLNRLVADIDTLDGLYLRLVSPLLLAVAGSCALVILAAIYSGSVAILLAIILSVCLLVLPALFFRLGRQPGEDLVRERSQLRVQLLDYVAGQTELQLLGAVSRYRTRVEQAEEKVLTTEHQVNRVTALSLLLITALTVSTVTGVLWFGARDMAVAGLSGPLVVMLVLATMAAFEAIMPLPGAFQMLGQTQRAASRLRDITEQKPTVVFPEKSIKGVSPEGRVKLQSVEFSYVPSVPVLQNFDLTLEAGERVALMGATGCGKSSVLQLLTRDWPLGRGSIELDGLPLEQFCEQDLRSRMAVMPQRIHIFSASLRDNLLLACGDRSSEVDDRELLKILEQVGLDHLATEDQLLDIWLGSAGRALSGGEQRRVGLARVLLRLRDSKCRLVLLDEPTEGLDPETEKKMVEVLEQLLGDRTLLVVTHRHALLKLVQRVVRVGN